MDYCDVEKKLSLIKPGQFFRIGYKTAIPIKAEYKNIIEIIKVCTETVRTGVKYQNISSVTVKEKDPIYKSNKRWLIKNSVFENTNNNELYIRLANLRHGANYKRSYIIKIDKNIFYYEEIPDEFTKYIIPSYFTKNSEVSNRPIKDVKISNIIMIKKF